MYFMFFDDNIRYINSYIVDTRHVSKHGKVPFIGSLLQSHLHRTEPLEAIWDKDYFVKHVARLESGYEKKLEARSRWSSQTRKVCDGANAVLEKGEDADEYDAKDHGRSEGLLPR